MEESKIDTLKWRFDISTYRLIGRELISDRVTALFELIKNCYDANSTRVDVIFENVSIHSEEKSNSKINVIDDGHGMSFSDIRDKWMVIGTSNKRKNLRSASPFNRRQVGEKGIGRFAVDKLGDKVLISTRTDLSEKWLNVEIDWQKYFENTDKQESGASEEESLSQSGIEEIKLFTDINNHYFYTDDCEINSGKGTNLSISNIREIWTQHDIERFINEVKKIVSPFVELNPPFEVYVTALEFGYKEALIESDTVDFATLELEINSSEEGQESLYFNKLKREISKKITPIRSFGGVSLRLFYFNESAKRKYNKTYGRDNENKIDGIKIYRDGLITTPFAEAEKEQDRKRDILGIDKRLWRDLFNRVSTREIIGYLEITKDGNPKIIDSTNRQDFIDNEEYRALKEFIIEQLTTLEEYKVDSRRMEHSEVREKLFGAKDELVQLRIDVETIAKEYPYLKQQLSPLVSIAKRTTSSVNKALKVQKEREEEFVRKENMYLSIMSLQEYSIHIAHAVRTSLGKIQTKAEFFNDFFPNSEFDEFFKLYAKEIFEEMVTLDRVVEFMLSYSQSNLDLKEVNISGLLNSLFYSYSDLLISEHIEYIVDCQNNLILLTQESFLKDIFQNLITNSIKFLKGRKEKLIKCSVALDNNQLSVLFSDTGPGISIDKRDWIFGIYNTTSENLGGAGIGLYIAKTRVESLQGEIKVVDSEFDNLGTSFLLTFPLKIQN